MASVLFVDDVAEVRHITQAFLESEGVDVTVASNGREALALLEQRRPDLIVSDILMPVMDGFELCREVKSNPDTRGIPFIFYTSTFLTDRDREFAAALGVADYLTKPMRLDAFLAAVTARLAVGSSPALGLPAVTDDSFTQTHARILTDKLHTKSSDLECARREIESRHTQFSHLVNRLEEPVAELSGDLRIVYVNQAFIEWLGVEQGGLYGMDVEAALGRKFHEALTSYIKRNQDLAGGNEAVFEVGVTLPDQRMMESRVTLLMDEVSFDERYVVLFSRTRKLAEQVRASISLIREVVSKNEVPGIVGTSKPVLTLMDEIKQVAPTLAAVLIQGESGTGKELVANAIHSLSDRCDGPLVKVNCGAIPAGLFESELFGHERGAFTGAEYRRIGRFEQANGGTLFLDEVAELSPEMQVKLLRALQDGVIERVGSESPVKVNVRLIAATNSELEQCVREGHFRLDLYYRLNVFPLTVPPLRQRPEDIPLLADYFLRQFSAKNRKAVRTISVAALKRLQEYSWPGNIRQLQNVLERAVIVAQGAVIQPGDIKLPEHSAITKSLEGQTLVEIESAHIIEVLDKTHWAIAGKGGAADLLGMNPSTLRSRMKKYGIRRPS